MFSLVGRGHGRLRSTLQFRDACRCITCINTESKVDCDDGWRVQWASRHTIRY